MHQYKSTNKMNLSFTFFSNRKVKRAHHRQPTSAEQLLKALLHLAFEVREVEVVNS